MNKSDKLIDLDAVFSEYLNEWYQEHKSDYADFADLEEAAAKVYDEWAEKPLKLLGNVPPKRYYEAITDPKELVALTVKYTAADMSPPVLLCDRIAKVKECEPYLKSIIEHNESAELTVMAANILTDMQSCAALPVYIDWIFGKTKDPELLDLAAEKLIVDIETAGETIVKRMDGRTAELETARYIADVLTHYNKGRDKDGRVYDLLVKLFEKGGDAPLYAAYLGKYGDKRALDLLIPYGERQDINYLEYIEIRNAVEALGGELVNNKDFSNDKYYKALKGC